MIRTDCIHHHDYSIGNKNICDRYDGYCFVKDSENPVEVCKHFKSKDTSGGCVMSATVGKA